MRRFLFIYSLLIFSMCLDESFCSKSEVYVRRKRSETTRYALQNPKDFNKGNGSSMQQLFSLKEHHTGNIIHLFNVTYLMLNNDLVELSPNSTKTILSANTTKVVTFSKGFQYKNLGYLTICFDSFTCDIYAVSPNDSITFVQTLAFSNNVKELFNFEVKGRQHLAVNNNIYIWTGTFFDRISQLQHDGNVLCTFSYGHNQVIISNEVVSEKKVIIVYELTNNKLIKLQELPHLGELKSVVPCKYKKFAYVLFLYDTVSLMYLWMDGEIIFWGKFEKIVHSKISIGYFNDIPIFLATTNDSVHFYEVTNEVKHLYDVPLSNKTPKMIVDALIVEHLGVYLLFNTLNHTTNVAFFVPNKTSLEHVDLVSEPNELSKCMDKLEKHYFQPTSSSLKLRKTDPSLVAKFFQTRSITEEPKLKQNLESTTKIINGKVIIKNNLFAQNFKIEKSMFLNDLNRILWTPDLWLSKTRDQFIQGPVIANNLNVGSLDSVNTQLFQDLLISDGNVTIKHSVTVSNNIEAQSVTASTINGIKLNELYLKNSGKLLRGIKHFKNINTENSTLQSINEFNASNVLAIFGDQRSRSFNFSKDLHVESLELLTLNGIDFDRLYLSAFKVGVDAVIKGNLNVKSAKMAELSAKEYATVKSALFLTKNTPQIVNSTIQFINIDANNIFSNNINGDNIDNFVTNENVTNAKGNIRINNIKIRGDLHLNGFMTSIAENERILGTNETDLMQIYNKNVTIKGDLIIGNLLFQKNSVCLINSSPFSYDDLTKYWLSDQPQSIESHVTFKSGLEVPSMDLTLLNERELSNYVRKDDDIANSSLIFKHLIVNGNLLSSRPIGCEKLVNESVKITGEHLLRGKKVFAGNVGVNKLKATRVNNVNTENIASPSNFVSNPTFSTIVFKENILSESTATEFINNKNLVEIANVALRINSDIATNDIIFDNVTVVNMDVGNLNTIHFNEYIASIDRIYQLKSIENVIVSTAIGRDFNNVQFINSRPFLSILEHEDYSLPLNGEYHFESTVFVKDLLVAVVNDINFGELTKELLYRNWAQDIEGKHTFKVLSTARLSTPAINSNNLLGLIDVNSELEQTLQLPAGLRLRNAVFTQSLYSAQMRNDINVLTNTLRNEPTRNWATVTVKGDVNLLDETCQVQQLISQAVSRESAGRVIAGEVSFEHVKVNNMAIETVNGFNINQLLQDAVLKNGTDQLILGKKQFIKLSASGAASLEDINIPVVNQILLKVVNDSILHKNIINSIVVRGQKTFFSGLQTGRVITSQISNILTDNLVSRDLPRTIPTVKFDTLNIKGNLDLLAINNVQFNDFLTNRLLLNGPPQSISTVAYIDHLQLNGPSVSLPYINKIMMEDVVFDEDVIIESVKMFQKTVQCSQVYTEKVNERDLSEMFKNSIFIDDPVLNVSSIRFKANVILDGEISASSLNGFNMASIRGMVDVSALMKKSDVIQSSIDTIRESLQNGLESADAKAAKFLYLEVSTELQVSLANITDARVTESSPRGDLLMHVNEDESSTFCALPQNCSCLRQHTVHISPEYSVGLLENKGAQRVFTYYNKDIAVNVVANGVSTSSHCRVENITGESTSISWTIATNITQDTSFVYKDRILGYVNDVAFFSHNDILYLVISRLYNAQTDSDDADALVMRFSANNDQLELVQSIPATRSSNARIHMAPVGIILITDSTPTIKAGIDIDGVTNIYRFNDETKFFDLLRTIRDGACYNSQLLSPDELSDFVVLTCPNVVKVFKYYEEYKNYYLYQVINEEHLISATVIEPDNYARISPLLLVSSSDSVSLYQYRSLSGFVLLHKRTSLRGLQTPEFFSLNSKRFLFCPMQDASSNILKIVTRG